MSAIAPKPSCVSLPETVDQAMTVWQFLCDRFSMVPPEIWTERILAGRVTMNDGMVVTLLTRCVPQARLWYFREVKEEPKIPFQEEILFVNEHILVACKPHFLPVHPAGRYVKECLVYRLRERTGNPDLVPVNRLDRETAGLVLFSAAKETRKKYYGLFMKKQVRKMYEALALLPHEPMQKEWIVETCIVKGSPWFVCRNGDGEPNAKSIIRLVERRGNAGRFELEPCTGKQHQLRLHMSTIGFPILHDPWYPVVQDQHKEGYGSPLQLLARKLEFVDPLTKAQMVFESQRELAWLDSITGQESEL